MFRRSAPVLLCLFVCLLAVHLSSASATLRIDESRIKVSLDERQTRVSLAVENDTGHARVEWLQTSTLRRHNDWLPPGGLAPEAHDSGT